MKPKFKEFIAENSQTFDMSNPSLVGSDGVKISTDGGYIDIKYKNTTHSPRSQSIVDFVVDEKLRGKGIGKALVKKALSLYRDLGGQASSIASVAVLYSAGFRNPSLVTDTLQSHIKMLKDDSSVYMCVNDETGKRYI